MSRQSQTTSPPQSSLAPSTAPPFTLLMPGKNMGIFMYRKFDAPEQVELSLRESYGRVVSILYPVIGSATDIDQAAMNAASTAVLDAVASSRTAEERGSIASGLIFGFIAMPARKAEQAFYTLLTTCISDWSSYAYAALEGVMNAGFYRVEPESRGKLMNIVMEMVRCASPYAEEACIHLMRCIPGSKPYLSCDLGNLVLNALSMNKKWLLEHPSIVAVSFYTFLRLIPEHNKPEFKSTFDREIGYCLYLWKERPTFCLKIGRDVIRALQDVGHVKVFHDILLEISRGASFKEVGGTPTTRQILMARITPEMERDISFLLNNVTYAQQKYYQGWLFSKYFVGDCEYIIPDVVRYVCCICDPPEENKARDILDRWAFVGWLYSQMRTDGGKSLVKQAVFYDWYWFNPEVDKVSFLEPAAGVMSYSLAQYREMTATFLEFLVISSEVYCVKEKSFIIGNIKKSFKALVAARKFQSFQQLFDFDGVHKIVHDKFITFNSFSDSAQDKLAAQQNSKQPTETKDQKQEAAKAMTQHPQDTQKIQPSVSRQPNTLKGKEEPGSTRSHSQRESEKDQPAFSTGEASELFAKKPTFDNFLCAIKPYVGKQGEYDTNFLRISDTLSGIIEGDIINCTLNSILLCNRGVLSMLFETVLDEKELEKRQVFYDVMINIRKHHPSIGYRFFAYTVCRSKKEFSSSPRSFLNRHFMGNLPAFANSLVEDPNVKVDIYMEFASKIKERTSSTLNSVVVEDFAVCAKQCPSAYALLIPVLLRHIDLDAKTSSDMLTTSAQFLLPNEIDALVFQVEKGSFNVIPQSTEIGDALDLVSRSGLEPPEKAGALRLVLAEYIHRGTLSKFIQDMQTSGTEKADKSTFFNLPLSSNSIRIVFASFSTMDAQEILDALFQRDKDGFTECLCLLLEDTSFKRQMIDKLSEMGGAHAWINHSRELESLIKKEHKENESDPSLDILMETIAAHTEDDEEQEQPQPKKMKTNA